jgi:uncharacterized membrane protein YraQ (UPF0718 family)
MAILQWLNEQLLRMDWLAWLVRVLLEDLLGLYMASRVGARLHFFIYDVIKIFIMLVMLIFSISWVQSYFPPQRTRPCLATCAVSRPSSAAPYWAPSRRFARVRRSRCLLVSPVPAGLWA